MRSRSLSIPKHHKFQLSHSLRDPRVFVFWCSVGIVTVLLLFLLLVLVKALPIASVYNSIAFTWYEYVMVALFFALPPALFGLTGASSVRKEKPSRYFFIRIAELGIASQLMAYIFNQVTHIDCVNDCVDYMPNFQILMGIMLASGLLTILLPFIFAFRIR